MPPSTPRGMTSPQMSAVPRRGTPDLVGVELPETKDMPKRVRNGILFQDLKKEKKNPSSCSPCGPQQTHHPAHTWTLPQPQLVLAGDSDPDRKATNPPAQTPVF